MNELNLYRGSKPGKWAGKKGVFDGDSITYGAVLSGDTARTTYPNIVKDLLALGSVVNNAVSGTSLTTIAGRRNLVSEYQNLPSGDFVFISVGTNDYGYNAPIGTEADTDVVTFWGALNVMMDGMLTKFPTTPIVLATPIHRVGDANANTAGFKLIDYVNAMRQAGEKWGIPILDMYTRSGMNPNNAAQKAAFFNTDGLHPYTKGGLQRLAERVAGYMNTL